MIKILIHSITQHYFPPPDTVDQRKGELKCTAAALWNLFNTHFATQIAVD